jgi:hypothetical protein
MIIFEKIQALYFIVDIKNIVGNLVQKVNKEKKKV